MADPIARAIGTFSALKGMDLRQQQFEQQQQDRVFTRGMAVRAEDRAQQSFDMDRATRERESAWQDKSRGRQVEEWADSDTSKARSEADRILLEFTKSAEASQSDLDVPGLLTRLEPVQQGLKRKLAALYDPQRVEEQLVATKNLLGQIRTGEFDHDGAVENINIAFADELDERGRRNGLTSFRINRAVPSPEGDGVMFGAKAAREDGTAYEPPLTENGGTSEQGDNAVKNFRMDQLAPYLVGKLKTLQGAKAYLEGRGLITKPKIKAKEGGSDETGRYLYDENSGEVIRKLSGPVSKDKGGSGSSGGGKGSGLKDSDYKLFDDQLNKQFLAEFQTTLPTEQQEMADMLETDAFGNQRVSMERVVAKMPPEMRERYNAARQAGENFMADGGLTPILAANKAHQFSSRKDGGGQEIPVGSSQQVAQKDIDGVSPQRLAYLQQWLKNAEDSSKEDALGLLEHLKKTAPAEYAALTRPLSNRGEEPVKPPQRGMAPFREEVNKKGLLPMAAQGLVNHINKAQADPRFPGWK